ncbi:hypothetical protein INT47_001497 [Mucor saturninus]|uniref:DM2 domain-containing protein n=1 Tax=Mucor saturninus TaxID=64648 RepID=A0A8H7R167_9FUNG|nr:hypothetical protein INT47_001497 [Mucor saturninus]
MAQQYKSKIEDILKKSDLSCITTKSVRRELESQAGVSLTPIKKEVNKLIEETFLDFQEAQTVKDESVAIKQTAKQKADMVVAKKVIPKAPGNKVTKKVSSTTTTVTKTTKKKPVLTEEEKKQKALNQTVYKIIPPLSDIIGTEVCSRFRTVKKIWSYIRKHNLQVPTDKRKINCDENLKKLTGLDQVTGFSINKYTQKCFVPIPKEDQPKYKQIFKEQEEALDEDSS